MRNPVLQLLGFLSLITAAYGNQHHGRFTASQLGQTMTLKASTTDQQVSTESILVDVHSQRTTAQGSQITTDSTQDG
jgi:hypothetical protein